jgi:hypothetical protein
MGMAVTNFQKNAAHKQTVVTHEDYVREVPPNRWTAWLSLDNGRTDRCAHDITHGQHLGTGQRLAGNMLAYLCTESFFGPWPGAGLFKDKMSHCLRDAYQVFRTWRKANKVKCAQPRFTASRIGRTTGASQPDLTAKACNCKAICMWLAEVAQQHFDKLTSLASAETPPTASKLRTAKVVAACSHYYVEFLKLMDENGHILPVDAAELISDYGYLHLQCYAWLSKQAIREKTFTWGVIPKHHYLTHALDDVVQHRINPRFNQLLCAEDFVGRISRIASACHRMTCGSRTLSRYLVLVKRHLDKRRCTKPAPTRPVKKRKWVRI